MLLNSLWTTGEFGFSLQDLILLKSVQNHIFKTVSSYEMKKNVHVRRTLAVTFESKNKFTSAENSGQHTLDIDPR